MGKTWKEKEETRHVRELRKQIIKLKRENAQLRKRATRLENDWIDYEVELEEDLEKEFEKVAEKLKKPADNADKLQCPKCQSHDVVELTLRDLPYYKCHGCGSKGRLIKP